MAKGKGSGLRFFRGRPLLILGLGGVLGLAAWGLWTALQPTPPPPPPPVEKQAKMEGLSLTEIKEGSKRWVLSAKKAEHVKGGDEIRIQDIYLEFYGQGQEVVYLRAREGLVHVKTRDLTLKGGVELELGDLAIQTDLVRYLPQERALVAPENTVLKGPRMWVSGKDLRIDLAGKRLLLKQHQRTEVKLEKGLL